MLELRPNCECCDRDLDPASPDVLICTYECTWCRDCAENILHGICPNCGGELVRRPIRPAHLLTVDPPSTKRVVWPGCASVLTQVRRGPPLEVVPDPQPHRPVHRITVKVGARHPPDLAALLARRRLPAGRPGGQHDGELLPGFRV